MAKGENLGQSKTHLVEDAEGNRTEMSQTEWKNRDKSLGLRRVDEEAEVPADDSVIDDGLVNPAPAVETTEE